MKLRTYESYTVIVFHSLQQGTIMELWVRWSVKCLLSMNYSIALRFTINTSGRK